MFNIADAEQYGVDIAIILNNIRFWIEKNQANKTNIHDGYVWTYNSASAFSDLFPYWTQNKIQKTLKKMESEGILITGNFNKAGYDRTKWFTLPEYAIQPNGLTHSANPMKASSQMAQPIPDSKPDNKPSIKDIVEQKPDPIVDDAKSIVQYLNEKSGKMFSDKTAKTLSLIKARLKDLDYKANPEGALMVVRMVIDHKCQTWANDNKMRTYLRPETLFGGKFESYANDANDAANKPVHDDNQWMHDLNRERGYA